MIYARSGDKGHNVMALQDWLNKTRGKHGSNKLLEDGIFGGKTLRALINAQRWLAVKPDGIMGTNTYTAMRKKMPHISTGFTPPSTPDIKYFDKQAIDQGRENKAIAMNNMTTIRATEQNKSRLFRKPLLSKPIESKVIPESSGFAVPIAIAGGLGYYFFK